MLVRSLTVIVLFTLNFFLIISKIVVLGAWLGKVIDFTWHHIAMALHFLLLTEVSLTTSSNHSGRFFPYILHIPNLSLNIFVDNQITNHYCHIYFDSLSCYALDRCAGSLIGRSHKRGGLCYMDRLHLHLSSSVSSCVSVIVYTSVDLWHHWPGHLSQDRLCSLICGDSLESILVYEMPPCMGCKLNKWNPSFSF